MLRKRLQINPLDAIKNIPKRINAKYLDKKLRMVKRGNRHFCWCGGKLSYFQWHDSYGVCNKCGCYVNRKPPVAAELKNFYTLDNYWGTWMKIKGVPTIEGRTEYDLNDGRVAYWLSLVDKYSPRPGKVIEVGCGHAVLLKELQRKGYSCLAIEISEDVSAWIQSKKQIATITGTFPYIKVPSCNLFLAMDVLEHAHEPVDFFNKVYGILEPEGIAILQQPVIRAEQDYEMDPPFGKKFKNMFDSLEHLWIFTTESLRLLSHKTGFRILNEKVRWRMGHEILVLQKK